MKVVHERQDDEQAEKRIYYSNKTMLTRIKREKNVDSMPAWGAITHSKMPPGIEHLLAYGQRTKMDRSCNVW